MVGMLSKSEAQLPPSRRRLLEQQREAVTRALAGLEGDLEKLKGTILDVAEDFAPNFAPKGR